MPSPGTKAAPLSLLLLTSATAALAPGTRPLETHDLRVTLAPYAGRIAAADVLTLTPSPDASQIIFTLARSLEVSSPDGAVENLGALGPGSALGRYRAKLREGKLTIRYRGPIAAGPVAPGRFEVGYLGERGVYLDDDAGWIARVQRAHGGRARMALRLSIEHPAGWEVVSQGRRSLPGPPNQVAWRTETPQWHAYLVGGPLHRFAASPQSPGIAPVTVYLHAHEPGLAQRYSRRGREYLARYAALLGPYPYPKLAVIENFWETGYAMPSFMLLGPRVIRLPFILDTSYPHEIVHNWIGNGVYPLEHEGNWSEGLTAYLADHAVQESRGRGAAYRHRALQKYRSYVARADDFSLAAFRGGHGSRTQAVGYNKALMFFHMLRRDMGDRAFVRGLRSFYRTHRFDRAGYEALRSSFEAAGGRPLTAAFAQWVDRIGAPVLRLERPRIEPRDGRFRLTGSLVQVQTGEPYRLAVTLGIQIPGRETLEERIIIADRRRTEFSLAFDQRPVRVVADPGFDLFRRLDPSEVPPSLGELFGARKATLVLPRFAPRPARLAYERLAAAWAKRFGWALAEDDGPVPDGPLWLLGWRNRHLPGLIGGQNLPIGELDRAGPTVAINHERLGPGRHSVAVAGRTGPHSWAWLASDNPRTVDALGRRLPHYGGYGYAIFNEPDASVSRRGEWPVRGSILERWLVAGGQTRPGRVLLAPRAALIDPPP